MKQVFQFQHLSNINYLFIVMQKNDIEPHSIQSTENIVRIHRDALHTCDDRTHSDTMESEGMGGAKIYRFKFTEEFMQELHSFSKVHKYDDKNTFKESWKNFVLEQEEIVYSEVRRLKQNGYDGDIIDKMYKSARYYFRKKSNAKKDPKERRKYITFDPKILDAMDCHIKDNLTKTEYQPKNGFSNFCKENEAIVREYMAKLYNDGLTESKSIEDKFKKTYKNRYFMITRK